MDGKYLWELSDAQLHELKRQYMDRHYLETENRLATDEELARVEDCVSYDTLFDAYEGTVFFDSEFECKKMFEESDTGKRYSLEEMREGFETNKSEIVDDDSTTFEDWLSWGILTGELVEVEA